MRIGSTGGATSTDKVVRQAQQAEADGFASLWFASGVPGDSLAAMAVAGRATTSIELGTAVSPRMLRGAGAHADGTTLWMASAPFPVGDDRARRRAARGTCCGSWPSSRTDRCA